MRWLLCLLSALLLIVSGQVPVPAGDKAADYLKGDMLKERIEVVEALIGGFGGVSGGYFAVEPNGSWTAGGVKGPPLAKPGIREEKAKGKLTKEQLSQLAKEFARNDFAHLPSHGVPASGSKTIEIYFGKKVSVLNANPGKSSAEEDKAIRARYNEIAQAVKILCKEPKK